MAGGGCGRRVGGEGPAADGGSAGSAGLGAFELVVIGAQRESVGRRRLQKGGRGSPWPVLRRHRPRRVRRRGAALSSHFGASLPFQISVHGSIAGTGFASCLAFWAYLL